MRLDVDRVHVTVFVEREGKSPDRCRAVAEREVVAEGFVLEHRGSWRSSLGSRTRPGLQPETQIMILRPTPFRRLEGSGRCVRWAVAGETSAPHWPHAPPRHRYGGVEPAASAASSMLWWSLTSIVLPDFARVTWYGLPAAGARKRSEWRLPSGQPAPGPRSGPSRSCRPGRRHRGACRAVGRSVSGQRDVLFARRSRCGLRRP